LTVSHAFHSARMEPMLAEFGELVGGLSLHAARVPIASNVTGRVEPGEYFARAGYWVEHVRAAVRFHPGVLALAEAGATRFIEVGPQGVLSALVQVSLPDVPHVWPLFRRGQPEHESLLHALASLHASGYDVSWAALLGSRVGAPAMVPTYPFERRRYWLEPAQSAVASLTTHPLIVSRLAGPAVQGTLFSGRVAPSRQHWVSDHRVFDEVVVPGTALLELGNALARELGAKRVAELTLESPLVVPAERAVELQVGVAPTDGAGYQQFTVHARPEGAGDDAWIRHASGALAGESAEPPLQNLVAWPPEGATRVELGSLYAELAEHGLAYGPAFQALHGAYRAGDTWFGEVRLDESTSTDAERYVLHPALLDAALHVLALAGAGRDVELPFSFGDVDVWAPGARALRFSLHRDATTGSVALGLWNELGRAVGRIGALRLRGAQPGAVRKPTSDQLYELLFQSLNLPDGEAAWRPWAGAGRLAEHAAPSNGRGARQLVLDVDALAAGADHAAPWDLPIRALDEVRAWLSDPECADTTLWIATRHATAISAEEAVDPLQSAVWGLVRSAQNEHPERALRMVDVDDSPRSYAAFARALTSEEPQIVLRDGYSFLPRIVRTDPAEKWVLPSGEAWSLQVRERGTLDGIAFVPHVEAPLGSTEVRLSMRATGLNFRDVLSALGMYPGDPGPLGYEGAGVVLEVGDAVRGLSVGDRVMGLVHGGFSPRARADYRHVVKIPAGLNDEQAAGIPIVFLTAYYALVDLAGLQPGEKLLVHAAAGGVGLAALQVGRHLGAEVFGTASEGKQWKLREQGLTDTHIASSRDTRFEAQFAAVTGGIDVVLDSLSGEFVDASLRLLVPGGRFIEMGKTDVRDPSEVARAHRAMYRSFDLSEAGYERTQEMLAELSRLFEAGTLAPIPVTCWDVREAPQAFRHMAQAKHIGKIVLRRPPSLAEGPVIVTGASGTLAAQVARHLVREHGVRELVLCARRAVSDALLGELRALGATTRVAQVDVGDVDALGGLLASIDRDRPLGIVHTAGSTDDALLESLTPERVRAVFEGKVTGAWNLHTLTADRAISRFIMFSSVSGVLGGVGQASYAAANAFLDGLAQLRREQGRPATALAWGLWSEKSALTAHLKDGDIERMARAGLLPLSSEEALALFDRAVRRIEPVQVPFALDRQKLAVEARTLPPILRALARPVKAAVDDAPASRADAAPVGFAQRLLATPAAERDQLVLEAVRAAVGLVMRVDASEVAANVPLKQLGLDSLMAVELRNQLATVTGLRLPSTLLFDYPTSAALGSMLRNELEPKPEQEVASLLGELDRLEAALLALSLTDETRAALAERIQGLSKKWSMARADDSGEVVIESALTTADDDTLYDFIDRSLGQ
jgi:NADPH:quinone reductase-like Zn-dependent oxidoreductase/NAD(P)-dependent dehydrogenase (short-subunit alcohol dehydrogenase family)